METGEFSASRLYHRNSDSGLASLLGPLVLQPRLHPCSNPHQWSLHKNRVHFSSNHNLPHSGLYHLVLFSNPLLVQPRLEPDFHAALFIALLLLSLISHLLLSRSLRTIRRNYPHTSICTDYMRTRTCMTSFELCFNSKLPIVSHIASGSNITFAIR